MLRAFLIIFTLYGLFLSNTTVATADKLQGKVAVITGSTSGIGLGIAKAFLHKGIHVVINGSRPKEEVRDLMDELSNSGHAVYCQADLSTEDGVKKLINFSISQFKKIDILVNNAGIQHVSPTATFPSEKWDKIIALNLSSAFHAIKLVLPQMEKSGWGRIINISSVHGIVASKNKAAYIAAKHGLNGLTKVIGLEYAGKGITCNAICPGWVLTPLVQVQIDKIATEHHLDNRQATEKLLHEKQPSLQFVTPDQIAEMTLFLCSDAAAQITGSALPIDGGWTAR